MPAKTDEESSGVSVNVSYKALVRIIAIASAGLFAATTGTNALVTNSTVGSWFNNPNSGLSDFHLRVLCDTACEKPAWCQNFPGGPERPYPPRPMPEPR